MNPKDIYRLVESDLIQVENEILHRTSSNIQIIDKIGRYIQDSGGKRIRPALLLLSARASGYEGRAAHRLAAVIELVHAATLVHDDIIDGSQVRRGRASVNASWGSEITVLMGDWLYMTSFVTALGERQFQILDILADVTCRMVEGELIQLSLNGNMDITEEQLLDISMRKTAHLFSACTQIGAILGGVSQELQEAMRLYGQNLGMAFQLVDDVLDFTSTENTLGKPVGSDLREGKLTLPLIYLMREGNPQHRDLVGTVLREKGFRSVPRETIISLLKQYGTLSRVMAKARDYAARAQESLAAFSAEEPLRKEALNALRQVPEFIVERDR